jgi:hypothetical protein
MAPASATHENNVFYLISAILRGILGRYLERAREGAKLRDICRDSIVVFWGVGEAPVLLLAQAAQMGRRWNVLGFSGQDPIEQCAVGDGFRDRPRRIERER